ncbi:Fumarate hydratase class II [Candidatus Zixiibacteriota bacterium]|nr:Fumarate hydratase class II [candidate division Zixibacteria bacterium]
MDYRIEIDTLGEVKVPIDAYFGAQTQRAVGNFPISGIQLQAEFIRAQAVIKYAAARANMEAGALDKKIGGAITVAADEILSGQMTDQFVVDIFQAGAGTSQNMNINEVIANRAAEILGGKKGEYKLVHPNDHVNMAQSTNDTIHVAIHIAAVMETNLKLLPALDLLETELTNKEKDFDRVIKCGRTHLQDAVPIRLGQEFSAYAAMMRNNKKRISESLEGLKELVIGGTAVGTGLNAPEGYRKFVIRHINEKTDQDFRVAANMFEAMQSFDAVVEFAGALRTLITGLKKIADDMRLLGSGPRTGFNEIQLPPVQPGSSIMPGKVNPVLAEMLNMICSHAVGNDACIVHASQAGQLELNVMMPIIAYNLIQEIQILAAGMTAFAEKCIRGLKANEDICLRFAERSTSLATALNPIIGYHHAARLAQQAFKEDRSVRDLALEQKLADKETLDKALDLHRMTESPEES